ncbi:phosphotransferase system enzyme IIC component [Tetragenococcus halophilus subsp. halophilus]|uniref:PTS sugar transporter subunit IIC n=1 Tax=Tetragenococcus halophilus TaxID=51669 RepID=UPI000CAEF5EB|nr:PTS transporter subunit EIIC [Tetragenococcus halophilus]GBD61004.1 phosphotransferase system enzyme IIC component [Tetragenococcus halophilus subsp. halophilus]GBD72503.1 phosphotransferase system enzyme IIC component [Tetragenococcus halophilus subsp. halophilus]GBD75578.1 phosphotransferase system enzyme IIC component [Tetragenococcus halophilus subsp. halophilus]
MDNSNEKSGGKMERLAERLIEPLGKFANNKFLLIMRDSFMAVTPVIIIGSIFLLISTLGQDLSGNGPLIPQLSNFSESLDVAYGLTMNFTALYVCITVALAYSRMYQIDQMSAAVIGLSSFLLLSIGQIEDEQIDVSSFSANGMFVAIVAVFAAMSFYRFCLNKNIRIKMPSSLPPAVGNAFSSLLPMLIIMLFFWSIRSLLNVNLVDAFNSFLQPIINAGDNIFAFTIYKAANNFLWSFGVNGSGMLGGIFKPLEAQWLLDNASSFASGTAIAELPHIWTTPLNRMVTWTSAAWGLIFWLFVSKVKYHKIIGAAAAPSAFFSIAEPLIFSLPVMLNPFLMIPCILSPAIAGFVAYLATMLGFVNPTFIDMPFVTPPPILGFVSTGGDWRGVVIVLISFLIGILVYWPFFRAYEKYEMKKEQNKNASVGETV